MLKKKEKRIEYKLNNNKSTESPHNAVVSYLMSGRKQAFVDFLESEERKPIGGVPPTFFFLLNFKACVHLKQPSN